MFQIILLFILLIVGLGAVLFFFIQQKKKIQELQFKMKRALERDEFLKIEFTDHSPLQDIAQSFNTIGNSLKNLGNGSKNLEAMGTEKTELAAKLKMFENSISNLNLLTDIGKKIAASLSLDEIVTTTFQFIHSAMVAEEINLLLHKNENPVYLMIQGNKAKEIKESGWCEDPDNILNWSAKNNKVAFLQDAEKDFAQYVFKQPRTSTGNLVESFIAVPLIHANNRNGALVVYCKYKNAFESYHLDYLKSLASYVAVALENANLYEELNEEKQKSDSLLLNILPQQTAEELKRTGNTQPRQFKNVTVMFSDFKDFTKKVEWMSPEDLVKELDYCFGHFDEIMIKHGIEKIKTIGDAYMCAAGLPEEKPDHAARVVMAAIEIRDFMENYAKDCEKVGRQFFEVRIGINSGPVVAGVVGKSKFVYDIWGDTVNVANRMESTSESGKINISETTYRLVKDQFDCFYRGKFTAKNKGEIDMYFVNQKL